MNEKDLKEKLDEIYNIGVKNGGIEMKNKILKSLNRDWKLFSEAPKVSFLMKILKKINKIK
jgi:hypothetical protein